MTEPLDEFYRAMTSRLNQLRQERSELEEILAFYDKVLAAQQETQQQTTIPEIDLPEERLRLKVEEGFPLIDRGDFQVIEIPPGNFSGESVTFRWKKIQFWQQLEKLYWKQWIPVSSILLR